MSPRWSPRRVARCRVQRRAAASRRGRRPDRGDGRRLGDRADRPRGRSTGSRREHETCGSRCQAVPFSQIPDLVRNAAELGQPFDLAHWHAFAAAAAGLAEPLDDLWEAAGLDAGRRTCPAPSRTSPGTGAATASRSTSTRWCCSPTATRSARGRATREPTSPTRRFLRGRPTLVDERRRARAHASRPRAGPPTAGSARFGGDLLTDADDGEVDVHLRRPAARSRRSTCSAALVEPRPRTAPLRAGPLARRRPGVDRRDRRHARVAARGTCRDPRAVDPDIDVDAVVLPLPRARGTPAPSSAAAACSCRSGAEHRDLAFELRSR